MHLLSAQGPWVAEKGGGYGQLLFNTIPTYSSVFSESQNGSFRRTERLISEFIISPYAEYSVSDKLAIGAQIPYISVSTGNPSTTDVTPTLPADNLSSLGNVNVFGKYRLTNKKIVSALMLDITAPTSSRTQDSGLSTGVNAFSFQPKISVGGQNTTLYYYVFAGYGFRTNDHHDFANFGIELGLKLTQTANIILHVNRWQNINNGDPSVDSMANIETGLFTSFQQYTGVLFKIFVDEIFGLPFGTFVSFGSGSNADSVAASPAISFGVFKKW